MGALAIEEFESRVKSFPWKGTITAFHLHHTADLKKTWRGEASVESIRRYHVNVRKYRATAQHVTLGPDGSIWLGRDWNLAPASAVGHNGNDAKARPFMIEVFANFTSDVLEGIQRETLIRIIAAVQERFALPPEAIKFHREMQATQCPGDLDKLEIIDAVRACRNVPANLNQGDSK